MLKGFIFSYLLFSSFAISASEQLKLAFKAVYKSYQEAVEAKDNKVLLALAKQSYQLGCEYYGKGTINCSALALNYVYELKDDKKLISALFDEALTINIEKYGASSIEVADIYSQIAAKNTGFQNKKSIEASKKALAIANDINKDSPIASALIKLKIGQLLLRNNSLLSKVLLEANEELDKLLPEDDYRLIKSRFWASKYYQARGKTRKSIESLEKNIEIFNKVTGVTHPFELVSRAFLVSAYEKVREPDKATEHCIAIGEMTPWNENQEQTPLFRVSPNYPIAKARNGKEGWVKMEFTIDKNGFVKQPKVIESSGGKLFIEESLKAIKRWRYAPKFENGVAVDALATVQLDFKMG